MSHGDDTATRLLNELASIELPEDSSGRATARRRAAVGRMREIISADVQPLRNRWVIGLAAAATVLLALLGLWQLWPAATHPAPTVAAVPTASVLARGDGTEVIRDGHAQLVQPSGTATLRLTDVLQTSARSSAAVATTQGVAVQVQAATRVRFEPTSGGPGHERLGLVFGRIDVDVPEDGRQREFTVQTPQATVIVHGTRFTVEVARSQPDRELQTTVRVERGRVEVRGRRGTAMLAAGTSWSSRDQSQPAVRAPALPQPAASTQLPEQPLVVAGASRAPSAVPSSLAQQNAIYARAMQAKQRGDDDRVLRELDILMQRYPDSPLAPDARVERFRALKRLGRTAEAARSARRYLAEQPDGFAREEARDVALGRDEEQRP